MAPPLISMQNAGVRRDNRWAVRGLNFSIARGEIVTIVGPNGAGQLAAYQHDHDHIHLPDGTV